MDSFEYNQKISGLMGEAIKYLDTHEPVYKGCPNVNSPCFCTGVCHKVIGYRLKNNNPIITPEEFEKIQKKPKHKSL